MSSFDESATDRAVVRQAARNTEHAGPRRAAWRRLTAVVAAVCIVGAPGRASTQNGADDKRSTQSGVYTREQADRGRDLFLSVCVSCHTTASHATPAFRGEWAGRALSELVQYLVENMPQGNPGSLTPDEYSQVTAYMLKLNAMPAGDSLLPSDTALLAKIMFDTVPRAAGDSADHAATDTATAAAHTLSLPVLFRAR